MIPGTRVVAHHGLPTVSLAIEREGKDLDCCPCPRPRPCTTIVGGVLLSYIEWWQDFK
jgi:hypothetical protein